MAHAAWPLLSVVALAALAAATAVAAEGGLAAGAESLDGLAEPAQDGAGAGASRSSTPARRKWLKRKHTGAAAGGQGSCVSTGAFEPPKKGARPAIEAQLGNTFRSTSSAASNLKQLALYSEKMRSECATRCLEYHPPAFGELASGGWRVVEAGGVANGCIASGQRGRHARQYSIRSPPPY